MTLKILQTRYSRIDYVLNLTKILLKIMVQIPFEIKDVGIQSCNLKLFTALVRLITLQIK